MRIMHCCLAAFYIDDASYQENLLPKAHRRAGHEVMIVASTENYLPGGVLGYVPPRRYVNSDDIPVVRLPYRRGLPHKLARKLRAYSGLSAELERFAPDVIFLHDLQFVDARVIRAYKARHPEVRVFVDGHTDFINSARTWLSRRVLHGILYRWCARQLEPITERFWGVTPVRADFMRDMYRIPAARLGVLPMGYDDDVVDLRLRAEVRSRVRAELGIHPDEFVIITGGRLDARKRTDVLMRAMRSGTLRDARLVVFGSPVAETRDELARLASTPNIMMVGWATTSRVYDLFLAADLGCFPGTHSVLWEQAAGVGLPCIFRRWPGFEHVDLGGNCVLLDDASEAALVESISRLILDRRAYADLRAKSESLGPMHFAYSRIAQQAIS